jgi:membrane fusion protein
MSDLFRRQVVENRRERLLGVVSLNTPVATWLFTGIFILIGVGIVALLAFAPYDRSVRVIGRLVPEQGLVHVYALEAGVVEEVKVREGDNVAAGSPLIRLNKERGLKDARGNTSAIIEEIDKQEAELTRRIELTQSRFKTEREALVRLRGNLQRELGPLKQQQDRQTQRTALMSARFAQTTTLAGRGIVSQEENQRRQDELLAQQQVSDEIGRLILANEREIGTIESRAGLLQSEEELALADIRAQLSGVRQRRVEAESQGHVVIDAPVTGRVASVQARLGQSVGPESLQMILLPKDSKLEAELFVPTRAAGFIRPGQHVNLLYDAFPYQKFGAARGEVKQVSSAIINPSDLNIGVRMEEPVYRVIVDVNKQTINAYGQVFYLQSGMTLQADIVVERVILWELLFEPLLARIRKTYS